MAIYNKTRQQLRHLTARLCNDLIIGTVASPASGTFVCTATDWEKADDWFNDYVEMFCYSGTGIGTSGKPTGWSNSSPSYSHVLTFKPAATLTVGDLVEMHQVFTVATYNDFMNQAIDMVAKEALINKVDTSVELETDTYQYTLSTQFLFVNSIELESSTAGVYNSENPIDDRYWRVIKATTTKIEFVKDWWTPTDGRKIRISGLASPSILDTDDEECPLNPIYISYQAAALLHQSRIRSDSIDSEFHRAQMTLCQSMADRVRKTMRVGIGGGQAVVET